MSTSNASCPETVLVYAGPSVTENEVRKRVPHAVVRPPIRQSDLLTDLHAFHPTHVLVIDGEFQQSFSVWLKEILYALLHPGVQGVYGASSMGALRAADLADVGMVGCGKIFAWYDEGVVEDDAEVAVAYTKDGQGRYRSTVPLVNVRASGCSQETFEAAREIHWSERWPNRLAQACPGLTSLKDQKREDALELLETFRDLKPRTSVRPGPEHLGGLFLSQYDRDRRIRVGERSITLQRIDAAVALESPDRRQIFWDSDNRVLALVFADLLGVEAGEEATHAEGVRFCQRHGLYDPERMAQWLAANGLSEPEFHALMHENARVSALHRALTGTQLTRRKTRGVLDYLRTHGRFEPWAGAVAQRGDEPAQENGLYLTTRFSTEKEWRRHSQAHGIPVDGTFQDFLREYGFYSPTELLVELSGRRRDHKGTP